MTDHAPADDLAAAFQIEGWPVRGRIVRLGQTIDAILSAHAYPEPVAALLGEACALAALVGSSLKFEGRLIVQAQGDGPVRYVVADYDTDGHMRGYCRFDEAEVAAASRGFARPGARSLLGQGVFVMTLDRGPDFERTQGITPIEGESLSLAAEHYFQQSEQIPTKVRLAVGSVVTDEGVGWRAGGALIQLIAGDDVRIFSSLVSASTFGAEAAGNISLSGRQLLISGRSVISNDARTGSTGSAGRIDLVGDTIRIDQRARVSSSTQTA